MNNQEAIKALLEGMMIRQVDWAPNEFIVHRKEFVANDDLVLDTKQWVEFTNKMGTKLPLSQEEMQACLNRDIPFEEYVPSSSSPTVINDDDDITIINDDIVIE